MSMIPIPTFSNTGLIVPTEPAILAGVQSDINAAFGGTLNPLITTPQGQLAMSETAVIGDCNNQFLQLVNNVDPAYASGRMQDAIGRFYMMTRIAAASSNVVATVNGAAGTIITAGALAADQSGDQWTATGAVTIPSPSSIIASINGTTLTVTSGTPQQWQFVTGLNLAANTVILAQLSPTTWLINNSQTLGSQAMITAGAGQQFACAITGPTALPIGALNSIVLAVPGWDTIYNADTAVLGNAVESRAEFELRRQQSVAINAVNTADAVLAAVLAVPNVTDVYVLSNPLGVTSGAVVVGTISSFTMTLSSVTSGTVAIGQMVTGAGVAQGTYITNGAGLSWTVNISQTVSSTTLQCAQGGIPLLPHSIYVGVSGGTSTAVAQAIFGKMGGSGCDMNGNTTVAVQDTQYPYTPPYPTYQITYNILTPTPISVLVQCANNANIPTNAIAQIQAAIIATFTGANGSAPMRTGSTVFHSSFYAALFALGSWVQIYEILVGVGTANVDAVLMQINQEPTISAANITVTFA